MQGLLELEDHPGFTQLACPSTGILAWPVIRNDVFRLLLGDRLYPTASVIQIGRRPDYGRLAAGAVRGMLHGLRHPTQPADVLIVGTGAGLMPRRNALFNRYTDYFAELLGDRAWTIEGLFNDKWPAGPRTNQRLTFLASQRLAIALRSRASVSAAHRRLAQELVALAADRGMERLRWRLGEDGQAYLTAAATRRLAAMPYQARWARTLLGRVRPRLILIEEGCYGHWAAFNAVARDLGITVAEFQHGMVTPGHDAYNVAPLLSTSEAYRRTQPSAFLAYGSWWTDQFNAPVEERVVIGNPHRSEVLRTWQPSPTRQDIVVLGDGVETAAHLELCRRIAGSVRPPLRVVFRPHPLERRRIGRDATSSVAVDHEPDLYRTFARARAVIGEASTALFEATGLVSNVMGWDTPKSRFYLGNPPFERVGDPAEMAARASEEADVPHDLLADHVWAPGWSDRFRGYSRTVLARARG
jgi:hypothetical protein